MFKFLLEFPAMGLFLISILSLSLLDFRPGEWAGYWPGLLIGLTYVCLIKWALKTFINNHQKPGRIFLSVLCSVPFVLQIICSELVVWGVCCSLCLLIPELQGMQKIWGKGRVTLFKSRPSIMIVLAVFVGGWMYMKTASQYGLFPYQNGNLKQYAKDGSLLYESRYRRGQLHGLSRRYYPNGILQNETFYNLDAATGRSTTFLPTGQSLNEIDFDYGSPRGLSRFLFVPDGQHIWKWDGYPHGEMKHSFHHKNGNLLFVDTYRKGKKVSHLEQTQQGYEETKY